MVDVFDFDHTIYDGDVSLDFYFYTLLKHPILVRYIPAQCWHLFRYIVGMDTRTKFKEGFFIFLQGLELPEEDISHFWLSHEKKLKRWYLDRSHDNDVIISASPEFLIAPAAKKMKVHMLIATKMDYMTGKIQGLNCRGHEKVKRLRLEMSHANVSECYTDSLSDLPLLNQSKHKYIVKRDRVIPFSDYKPSRLKRQFFKKSFLTFIFVGVLNAVIGLSFAFLAAIFVGNKTIAFMIGYCSGLIPSYYLNSTMTFHNKEYSLLSFFKYCLSYVPNLVIQTVCVGIFVEVLGLSVAVGYIGAVAVGVPVTYVLVSFFAIKSKEIE